LQNLFSAYDEYNEQEFDRLLREILLENPFDVMENFPNDKMFDKLIQVLFYKPRSRDYLVKFMYKVYEFDYELNEFKVSHVKSWRNLL
jgi:hypothetical protein